MDKWTLSKGDVDLIVMTHSFIYKSEKKLKKLISYLRIEGEDNIDFVIGFGGYSSCF